MKTELTIGQRLRIARKAAGLTQDELGECIGVGKSQISNLEKDASTLTKANAMVLSERIGISLNWLMTGEGETPKPGQFFSTSKSSASGNTVTIGHQPGPGAADLQAENEKLRLENEYLKQRLKDKEEMIEILKKK